jgi:predicted nucleic acid-binding protein
MRNAARDSVAAGFANVIAIDTNVLVYAVNENSPQHLSSRGFLEAVAGGQIPACVFPQNLLEFYSVVTDFRRVPCPLSPKQAVDEIAKLRMTIPVIPSTEGSIDRLADLVSPAGPRGPGVYDTFIVAQMKDVSVAVICTYNIRDFEEFPIRAATPGQIIERLDVSQDRPGLVQDRPPDTGNP